MLKDFYTTFSALCFTVLGLWLVIVQQRFRQWSADPGLRRRSYGIALCFSLPGIMALVSLIDPQSSALWRTSYAVVALGGAVVVAAVRGPSPDRLGLAAYVSAILLFLVIGIVAINPNLVKDVGLLAKPVRVDAVLLCALVFLGVNIAWLFLFDVPGAGTRPGPESARARVVR